jgi:hypothetical protein
MTYKENSICQQIFPTYSLVYKKLNNFNSNLNNLTRAHARAYVLYSVKCMLYVNVYCISIYKSKS